MPKGPKSVETCLGFFYRILVLGIESRTLKSLRVKQSGKVTG